MLGHVGRAQTEELAHRLDTLVTEWKPQSEVKPILNRWVPVRVTR